jgi:hypothetical protein
MRAVIKPQRKPAHKLPPSQAPTAQSPTPIRMSSPAPRRSARLAAKAAVKQASEQRILDAVDAAKKILSATQAALALKHAEPSQAEMNAALEKSQNEQIMQNLACAKDEYHRICWMYDMACDNGTDTEYQAREYICAMEELAYWESEACMAGLI